MSTAGHSSWRCASEGGIAPAGMVGNHGPPPALAFLRSSAKDSLLARVLAALEPAGAEGRATQVGEAEDMAPGGPPGRRQRASR